MASFWKFGCGRLALLAAMGVFAGASAPAQAADLGGDCCADLEERIAELEATTARKGNRKVKLEVSGHVNEAVMFWDDGEETNAYVVTNDNARSRFRFKGEAKIQDGWKAGYLLEIGYRIAHSGRVDQNNDDVTTANGAFDIRHSHWFIDSVKYGRLSVGLTGGATEGITEINQAATKDILKYADPEDQGLGMILRVNGSPATPGALSWRQLLRDGGNQPGEGRRHNLVKYDTPEIAGFIGTVSFGEDDSYTAGVRYKGDLGDFTLAAGIAYGATTDGNGGEQGLQCPGNDATAPVNKDVDCEQVGGSASLMHRPSGIYVNFGAGYLQDDQIANDSTFDRSNLADDDYYFYAGEVGIEQKWNELGKTTLFAQYFRYEGGSTDDAFNAGPVDSDVIQSELEAFGVGVIQGVDNAAMHVYLTYRHYEGEVGTSAANLAASPVITTEVDDLDVVMGGAIIRF